MARFTNPGDGNGSGLPGPQGDPGPAGADGESFSFRGAYGGSEIIYNLNDVVTYNGSSYICLSDNVTGSQPDSLVSWDIFVEKGTDGADGADGLDGSNGDDGADGIDGADALWNYTGEYNGGASYAVGDIATYDGQLWYRYNSNGGNVGDTPSPGLWNLLAAKGADGADGSDGTNGADGNDGSPGLVYLGNYVSGNGYLANVAVVKGSDNNLYIATSSGGLSDPVGNTAEWDIFLPKGADGADGAAGGFGFHGSFYDTQTQEIVQGQESIGIPVLIRSIDSDATSGFTVVDNSKMRAQYAGVYNFAFSFQFHNDGGGGNGQTVEIWFAKNGTAIPDSNTRIAVNTNSPYVVSAWNIFQKLNATDYLQMYWATDNHHIRMKYNTGTMGGPAIPSAIITVNQVG